MLIHDNFLQRGVENLLFLNLLDILHVFLSSYRNFVNDFKYTSVISQVIVFELNIWVVIKKQLPHKQSGF